MLIMLNEKENIQAVLSALGSRLKEACLARNESQEVFAARVGLSRQSYAKMEKGEGNIPLIMWIQSSEISGNLESWENVLVRKQNLFEQYDEIQQKRKRAGRRRV